MGFGEAHFDMWKSWSTGLPYCVVFDIHSIPTNHFLTRKVCKSCGQKNYCILQVNMHYSERKPMPGIVLPNGSETNSDLFWVSCCTKCYIGKVPRTLQTIGQPGHQLLHTKAYWLWWLVHETLHINSALFLMRCVNMNLFSIYKIMLQFYVSDTKNQENPVT